jgi:hypothetical protein
MVVDQPGALTAGSIGRVGLPGTARRLVPDVRERRIETGCQCQQLMFKAVPTRIYVVLGDRQDVGAELPNCLNLFLRSCI